MIAEPVEWLMTLPPCYVSKFLVEADDRGAGGFIAMLMGEWNIAFNFSRAVRVWLVAVFIEMSPSPAEHASMKIGTPLFVMPIALAPLALHGQLFVSPIPWAVDSFNHSQDMSGEIGG